MSNSSTECRLAPCHNCGFEWPELVPGMEGMGLVTSDCRPWNSGRTLCWCPCCGMVQKAVAKDFLDDCCSIYEGYTVYYQSGGVEQKVFSSGGAGTARSEYLLRQLLSRFDLPDTGRLLDIGCGNGVLLKSFGMLKPGWQLSGLDLDERSRDVIMALPGVEEFYCCDLSEIQGRFDVVSLMHCLEHVPAPATFLRKAAALLKPDGYMLIEVPDFVSNPFDLTIADHCSHFTLDTLCHVATQAGLEPVMLEQGLVSKELTFLARPAQAAKGVCQLVHSRKDAVRALGWLERVKLAARAETGQPFGIFGTSIAGIWLFNNLGRKPSFFVEEDQNRVGRQLFGAPVLSPGQVPPGSTVFLAFSTPIARSIAQRLVSDNVRFVLPPEI